MRINAYIPSEKDLNQILPVLENPSNEKARMQVIKKSTLMKYWIKEKKKEKYVCIKLCLPSHLNI